MEENRSTSGWEGGEDGKQDDAPTLASRDFILPAGTGTLQQIDLALLM